MKAAETTGTCPMCHQPSSPWRCREVPMGWWCARDGLKEDPSRWILPTRDPLNAAQRTVDEAFAPLLDGAAAAVDEAMARHVTAEQEHLAALLAARQAGVSDVAPLMMDPHGNDRPRHPRKVTPEQRDDAAALELETREELHDAAAVLQRARVALTDVSKRRDLAMRVASTGQAPRLPRGRLLDRFRRR